MKKLILLLTLIMIIGIVTASNPYLGSFKRGDEIELKQTCVINGSFCDSCNISSVDNPQGNPIVIDVAMTKRYADFNFTLQKNHTLNIGEYTVNGYCREEPDVMKPFTYNFDVTPSGFLNTLGLYFIFLSILAGVNVLGFWIKEGWFVVIGGMGFIMLGIYSLNNGIAGFQDLFMTRGISFFEIGIGTILSVGSAIQKLDED